VNVKLCRGTVDAALYRVDNEEAGNRFRSGIMPVKAAGWCSGCAEECGSSRPWFRVVADELETVLDLAGAVRL
jgi:hypothetical protein